MKLSAVFAFAFAACLPRPAVAFFDPPYVTPAAPTAGETVSVNIRAGICDGIFDVQGYPQVTQQGDAIHVLLYGAHYTQSDLCIFGVGTVTIPVGTYAAGNYSLEVDLDYDNFPFGPDRMTIGFVTFAVAGAAVPESIPATTRWGDAVAIVLLMLAGTALVRLRGAEQCYVLPARSHLRSS